MKTLFTCFLALLLTVPAVISTGPGDDIAVFLKQANSRELGKLFSPGIELTLPGDDNLYTKDKAEAALAKFFKEHKPKSLSALHKVNSNSSYLFNVFILSTEKGVYRVACTLKSANGTLEIIEMRIEPAKGH